MRWKKNCYVLCYAMICYAEPAAVAIAYSYAMQLTTTTTTTSKKNFSSSLLSRTSNLLSPVPLPRPINYIAIKNYRIPITSVVEF